MRNYGLEIEKRLGFIRGLVESAGARGIVFGNSGGKDSALVGILCKRACDNTLALIMPCGSPGNYGSDREDAEEIARLYGISTETLDLSPAREEMIRALGGTLPEAAAANLAPRLRMSALYGVAARDNRLVAGTSNASERYMGYFTKWGDGAWDFNPIGDLRVQEVYEFLRYLGAPERILTKAPSAGLFEGQTDEGDMGISYESIDRFLLQGEANDKDRAIIDRLHGSSEHKRRMPLIYEAKE